MIGVVGDLHFKESLGYADYIKDRREAEKKEVLDFIVEQLSDCETIVMVGDQLNGRNNLSSVIKEFVAFLERFNGKEVYIIKGNHEAKGDGSSAIDFLKEIYKPNWHIMTNGGTAKIIDGKKILFLPYHTKAELEIEDNEEGTKKLLDMIPNGDILFAHHTISDTLTNSGIQTNLFSEIVLPKKELESRFKLVVGGHIHRPQVTGNTIITGSVFNNEVGEIGKKIWKINPVDMTHMAIDLPGRPIIQDENIQAKNLEETDPYPENAIVKIIISAKELQPQVEDIKKYLRKKVDAYILLEQYPNERKKAHFDDSAMLEFSMEELLGIFSEQKKVDKKKLLSAWELIKN